MLFDSKYSNIRQAVDLFRQMGAWLSHRARSELCRSIACRIYRLEPVPLRVAPRNALFMNWYDPLQVPVDLHVRFTDRPVQPRFPTGSIIVLRWEQAKGLRQLFNGRVERFAEQYGRQSVRPSLMVQDNNDYGDAIPASAPDDLEVLTPEPQWPPPIGDGDGHGNGEGPGGVDGGGNNGGGDGGGDNPNGPGGRGGMAEVVAHPVLFSVDRRSYARILENY